MKSQTALRDILFFVSNQRIGAINPDGSGECCPQFNIPSFEHCQIEYVFPDGQEAVLLSQDPPKNPKAAFSDPDGRGFAKTHLWRFNFKAKSSRELILQSQMRVAGVIPGRNRFVICGNDNNVASLFATDLDGNNREDFWSGPGYAYGTSPSPDGRKIAYHITGIPGHLQYMIYVIDLDSKKTTLIADDPDFLHFGPLWSPDGQWVVYQRCLSRNDPGHDHSDVCISRADGSEHKVLTTGQSHWFATSYGIPGKHGSGSNMPVWSPDGRVSCALLLPGSRTAWPHANDRPDTDHFNRDYHPELARGGTQICMIDPRTGTITPITHDDPPTWNFRLSWSPDGSRLAFIRADVGHLSELWVMDADGKNRRMLTRGLEGSGVDHPRWVRIAG